MANIEFSGFVYDDAGDAVASATVQLFDRNTTSPVRENTTTNSSGYWTMSESTEGRYDVKINKDSWVRWIKYDDEMQVESLEAGRLLVRGSNNAFAHEITGTPTAARTVTVPDRTGNIFVGLISYGHVNTGGTIQSGSSNISGAVKDGTGQYTVSWDDNYANTTYITIATLQGGSSAISAIQTHSQAVGSAQVFTTDNATTTSAPLDSAFMIMAIGDA
jgi:hypothetical protein